MWKRFHRALLSHLQQEGASTIGQLEQQRVHVLELTLDRHELSATVDSARRLGLVEQRERSHDSLGRPITEPEWALTDAGRSRTRGVAQVFAGVFRVLPAALFATALTAVLDQAPKVKHINALTWAPLVIASLFLVALVMALIHRRLQGASPKTVAKEWDRHAVELPWLNRWYTRPSRTPLYAVALLFMGVVGIGTAEPDLLPALDGLILPIFFLFLALQYYVSIDSLRAASLKAEAIAVRESLPHDSTV